MKFLKILFLTFFLANVAFADDVILKGKVLLTENKEFKENISVKAGTEVSVSPKTTIVFLGEVIMIGHKDKKIVINGNEESILRFVKSNALLNNVEIKGFHEVEFIESTVNITNSKFFKNKIGLKISRNSNANLDQNQFFDNELGMVVELKANAKIANSSFKNNGLAIIAGQQGTFELVKGNIIKNKQGIVLNQDGAGIVTNTIFEENEIGTYLYQNLNNVFNKNRFSKNKTAFLAEVYSSINISKSIFSDNDAALILTQYSSGKLRHNNFIKNKEAIILEKRSSPDIINNVFQENGVGIFCNFSSYPIITKNNFLNNTLHIKLGEFMSSDFERRVGSYMIQMKEVIDKKSRRSREFKENKVAILTGEVFSKHNYWDEKTLEEMKKKDNISTLYDGYDFNDVTYEGYGNEKYKIDKIIYKPFLTKPVMVEK